MSRGAASSSRAGPSAKGKNASPVASRNSSRPGVTSRTRTAWPRSAREARSSGQPAEWHGVPSEGERGMRLAPAAKIHPPPGLFRALDAHAESSSSRLSHPEARMLLNLKLKIYKFFLRKKL